MPRKMGGHPIPVVAHLGVAWQPAVEVSAVQRLVLLGVVALWLRVLVLSVVEG